MGRFSPQVPGFLWDTGPGKAGGIARGVENFIRARERKKAGERQEEDEERRREIEELNLALQGIRRGEAPTQTVEREQPSVFEGVDPSRSIGAGSVRRDRTAHRPEMDGGAGENGFARERPEEGSFASGPEGVAASLGELRQGGRPRMVAPPGAFVPGVGFTDRALFENPAARMGAHREATTRERPDPRFEQLTDEFYRERPEDPQAQLSEALGRLRHLSPEQRQALAAGVPESVVFREEPQEEEDVITVAGREFPNTPEGEEAALAWRRQHSAAGRDPEGPGGGRESFTEEELRSAGVPEEQIPAAMRDPVLARQLVGHAVEGGQGGVSPTSQLVAGRSRALGAAGALSRINPLDFYNQPDALTRRQNEILRFYGYNDVDELHTHMREMGLNPADAEPGAGGEGGEGEAGAGGAGQGQQTWQQRAQQLRSQGHDEEAIIAKLREEGLIR